MRNILEIRHLKKYFKDVKAVDDISFDIREGELFAFLGLNGAGKSTTINIICNALQKDSGEIFIDGINHDKNIAKIKFLIGVVFQNSVLDSKLTVLDNLRYKASLYNLSKQEFENNLNYLAEKLEFSNLLKRPLNKLSGGQKRRIDIARALIHNPKILILDEPTTGLDPKTRILVWNLINELRKDRKMTVMLTTHYMEEAAEADYVVIIDLGKIVASDTPNNLKNNYAKDYLKVYNYNSEWLKVLDDKKVGYKVNQDYVIVEFDDITFVKDFILENKNYINDFEVIKGKMDDVFLTVTGKAFKEAI